MEIVVLLFGVVDLHALRHLEPVQDGREVDALRFPVVHGFLRLQPVRAADHLLEGAEAHISHELPHLLREEEEVVDDVLRRSGELPPELRVLGGYADRAGVQVAHPHHDAARRDQWGGREGEVDRKSTRLNSSHANISYAVFCLKKKKTTQEIHNACDAPFYVEEDSARQPASRALGVQFQVTMRKSQV